MNGDGEKRSALIRNRLGRCICCWRRGIYTLTITGSADDGTVTGEVTRKVCDKHAEATMSALMPVAEEVGVTFDDGSRFTVPGPGADS